MKCSIILLVVLIISSAGCNSKTTKTVAQPISPIVNFTEIKGDVIGMSFSDYREKHPSEHCEVNVGCISERQTYAGHVAIKNVSFYQGQLCKVSYEMDHYNDLLLKLKERYGEPTQFGKANFSWLSGGITVHFSDSEKYSTLEVSDDRLSKLFTHPTAVSRTLQDRHTGGRGTLIPGMIFEKNHKIHD